MKILIVEDDENSIALFEAEIPPSGTSTTVFARSRDSALIQLQNNSFDLVVLDLKIPTLEGSLDSDINHGLAVHSYVQQHAPGTPILVFSAFGTFKIASRLSEISPRHDAWGCGQDQAMTLCREKSELAECLAHIQNVISHVRILNAIDVSTGGKELNLTREHKRILRIFSRMNQGVNARVSLLGGGLSDAKTVRLEVQDQNAAVKSIAVAKLGPINALLDEEMRYHHCIAPGLGVGGFAHLIKFVRAGAANIGGIFYGFAKDYKQTLVELLAVSPAKAAATIAELRRLETTWQFNATNRTMTIAEIRRGLIPDEAFVPLTNQLGFDYHTFEQSQIRMKWCCQHRDLHGINVLVQDGDTPLLIDYGEVEQAPACLDPLVLELSLLFHPGCKHVRGTWPTNEQALRWRDLAAYLTGSPLEPFVRACREWAFTVEPLDKAVYATAYSYAVRQLKFPDTDHALAVAIAKAAHTAFLQA
jgi:CheY-like chemotaxis protein